MVSAKCLVLVATCLLPRPSAGRAMILAIRDDGNDDGGAGPARGPGPEGKGRPTSSWTFWPLPTTTPLTPAPPVTTSGISTTSSGPSTTTTPVVISTTKSIPPPFSTIQPTSAPFATTIETRPAATSAGTETLVTAMPSDMQTSSSSSAPTATDILKPTDSSSDGMSGLGSNRTLVITLSTVLSVVGAFLIFGAFLICLKYRKRRVPFFARGISPIDDDEIATWKTARQEKAALSSPGAGPEPSAGMTAAGASVSRSPGHGKQTSTSSVRKPPSVIVYQGRQSQQLPRKSGETSPRSINQNSPGYHGKMSFDKELPQTPIQAVAPNARAGLTDETIPGDEPFLPSPKRHPSRLSKGHPGLTSPRGTFTHTRTRSSRSSTRSFGGDYGYYTGSDMELSPRGSNEYYNNMHYGHNHGHAHSRVYSSSSIPPRLSFSEDGVIGGLSPRPLDRDNDGTIGRAIG